MAKCNQCGADWSNGEYSENCRQCGNGAMECPCPLCDGCCGNVWRRSVLDSIDSGEAHWIGTCSYPGSPIAVQRVIEYYAKGSTEKHIGDYALPHIPLSTLQKLFQIDAMNPMYDAYPLDPGHVNYFQALLRIEFKPEQYDYYLSSYKKD